MLCSLHFAMMMTMMTVMMMTLESSVGLNVGRDFSLDTFLVDGLVAKGNIYLQRFSPAASDGNEMLMESVERVSSETDIKVIVHGYTASRTHPSIKPLINAYRAQLRDNVFIADWEDAAGMDYGSSRRAIAVVAGHFGKILSDFLSKHNINADVVHLIGHSLGAHIAGGMGKYFNGTLGRITGLDPALPLFTAHSEDGLLASDAQFVDVLHTDYPVFGDLTQRGTADFYPNFGYAPQRGCDELNLLHLTRLILEAYSCSHNRAVTLYAESVAMPSNFPSVPCVYAGMKWRNANYCTKHWTDIGSSRTAIMEAIANMDDAQAVVYMGEGVTRKASGVYYLQTFDVSPYGMGKDSNF